MLSRLLAIAIGLVLSCTLGWWLLEQADRDSAPAIELLDGREKLYKISAQFAGGEISGTGSMRGQLGHVLLNELTTNQVFNVRNQLMAYDPQAYFRHPPFLNRAHKWKEHPAGEWHQITNSLGLREDRELTPGEHLTRIFVTGDSHTDGTCENAESYPHLLEAALKEAHPSKSYEVYNAGVGGYSFYNYLGAFDRYVEFEMEAYVVGVYGGNDFLGVLGPHRFFQKEEMPVPVRNRSQIRPAAKVSAPALSQGFFAYSHFAARPEDETVAIEAATEVTLALAKRCAQNDVRLIIAYIPPIYDVRPEAGAEQTKALREIFELSDEEMAVTERQANAYLAAIRAAGVEVVDLRPAFRNAKEAPYWMRDHHIDLQGHRLISEALVPLFD